MCKEGEYTGADDGADRNDEPLQTELRHISHDVCLAANLVTKQQQ